MTGPTSTDGLSPEELRRQLDQVADGPTSATFDEVFDRAQRSRRNWWTAATAAVVVLVTAAIAVPIALSNGRTSPGVQAGPPPTSIGPNPDVAAPGIALRLVNRWIVHAPGVTGEQLVLGDSVDGGLALYLPCGQLDGSWLADREGDFLAQVYGGDEACFHTSLNRGVDPTSVPWLDDAQSFTITDDGAELNDASGTVLARLTPSHTPPPHSPNNADGFRVAKLTPSLRASLDATPPALPKGVTPVTASSILGWWKPLQANVSPNAFLQFQPDSNAAGSDGCNGIDGRYALAGSSAVLTIAGPSGDVGCAIARVADEFSEIRRAGLDADGNLVVVDQQGTVLGKLAPVSTGHVDGSFVASGGPAIALVGHLQQLSGQIRAVRAGSHQEIGSSVSATGGRFSLDLPAGQWVFTGRSPHYGRNEGVCHTGRQSFSIQAGSTVSVRVICQEK